MTGKFMAYVLSVFTFFYMVLIGISFFMYMTVSERVNDICYDAAETVSTRGLLSEEVFSYIKGNLSCYGEYEIELVLERTNDNNQSFFYCGKEEILGKKLSKGDRLIISAVGENPSLFEKITGADMKIETVKVAIIN